MPSVFPLCHLQHSMERQLSASSVNVGVNAVRFLYGITIGRNTEALTTSVLF